MTQDSIEQALDQLAELYAERDVKAAPFKASIAEMELQMAEATTATDVKIIALEAAIKQAVYSRRVTSKGAYLMAVWSKGRVTWDTKGLDGYAVANPAILTFKREGEPGVSIRKVVGHE